MKYIYGLVVIGIIYLIYKSKKNNSENEIVDPQPAPHAGPAVDLFEPHAQAGVPIVNPNQFTYTPQNGRYFSSLPVMPPPPSGDLRTVASKTTSYNY